jgi:GNAT superfamily N-acetyltransferase
VKIRPATEDDLPDIGRIFERSSSWLTENYRPDQVGEPAPGLEARDPLYRHLLRTGAMFLAEDPEPAGFSAAIVRDGVWFLSLLWVLPERHGGGIGSALLSETLAWGRDATAFTVVASPYPVAQLVYLRSSMYPLWLQIDMAGEVRAAPEPRGLEELTASDQKWVDDLDREVRGTKRPEDHGFWREVARGLALHRDGAPVGYVYVWPEGKVGPGAAWDPKDMPAVLEASRHVAGERDRVTMAVPSSNWSALRELIRLGFAPLGSNTFMASRPLGDGSRYISGGGALG